MSGLHELFGERRIVLMLGDWRLGSGDGNLKFGI